MAGALQLTQGQSWALAPFYPLKAAVEGGAWVPAWFVVGGDTTTEMGTVLAQASGKAATQPHPPPTGAPSSFRLSGTQTGRLML